MTHESQALLAEQYRLQGVIRTGADGMDVEVLGGKFNLTDVAACVGLGQLKRLTEFTERRRELAQEYFHQFAHDSLGLGLPLAEFEDCNWHMFQVILPETTVRSEVMDQLAKLGIGTGVHYPAIHLFTLYRGLGWQDGDFPVAESICRRILSLPLFPTMTCQDVARVVAALTTVLLS